MNNNTEQQITLTMHKINHMVQSFLFPTLQSAHKNIPSTGQAIS